MHYSSFVTLLAGAAMVAAQDEYPAEYPTEYPAEYPTEYPTYSVEPTTTTTQTLTQTYTITKCNPTNAYCTLTTSTTSCTTSSSYLYPIYNTTVKYPYPSKSYPHDSYPTTKVTYVPTQPTKAPKPTDVVTSGASPLVQSGFLLGLVAGAVALLA